MHLTGSLASVMDSVSRASAGLLASLAFVTPKWFVSVWCGDLWEVYF